MHGKSANRPHKGAAESRRRLLLFLAQQRGQAMVEVAFGLPVLLLVGLGTLTLGLAMNNYIILTEATNIGARQLAISRQQTLDPCNVVATTVFNAAPSLAHSSFSFSFILDGQPYSGTTCASASATTGAPSYLVQGKPATVKVTYPCNWVIGKIFTGPAGPCVLTSQTTELIQ